MKVVNKIVALMGLVCALPLTANANLLFRADMLGANETVPNASTAFGTAWVTLHDDMDTLDVALTFAGLSAPAAAAHIHCCAAQGANAAVRIDFGSAGFPAATSGVFNHTFLLSALPLAGISVADFIAGLTSGLAYTNIHNRTFPGGEIRGQLLRVPEPASLALFGLGLLSVGFARRRLSSASR